MKTKKPHEETLTVMQFDKERRCLVEGGQRMVAVLRNYEAEEWERFLSAAPDMARALLELVDIVQAIRDGYYTADSFTDQPVRAALRKAGVLP